MFINLDAWSLVFINLDAQSLACPNVWMSKSMSIQTLEHPMAWMSKKIGCLITCMFKRLNDKKHEHPNAGTSNGWNIQTEIWKLNHLDDKMFEF